MASIRRRQSLFTKYLGINPKILQIGSCLGILWGIFAVVILVCSLGFE